MREQPSAEREQSQRQDGKEKKAGVTRVRRNVAEHRAGGDEIGIDARGIEEPRRQRSPEIGADDIVPNQHFVRGLDPPVAPMRLNRPPGA